MELPSWDKRIANILAVVSLAADVIRPISIESIFLLNANRYYRCSIQARVPDGIRENKEKNKLSVRIIDAFTARRARMRVRVFIL